MVNIVGGLVVFSPCAVSQPFLLKSQNEQRFGNPWYRTVTAEGASVVSETTPFIRALHLTDRHILSAAEIYSVPLSVFLGFIVPLITLFLHPDKEVLIVLWQLFPVYVAILRYILRAVLLRTVPHLCMNHVHVESDNVGLLYVYGVPSVVSPFHSPPFTSGMPLRHHLGLILKSTLPCMS